MFSHGSIKGLQCVLLCALAACQFPITPEPSPEPTFLLQSGTPRRAPTPAPCSCYYCTGATPECISRERWCISSNEEAGQQRVDCEASPCFTKLESSWGCHYTCAPRGWSESQCVPPTPAPTTKTKCTAGFYCPEGSGTQLWCQDGFYCPEGSVTEVRETPTAGHTHLYVCRCRVHQASTARPQVSGFVQCATQASRIPRQHQHWPPLQLQH